MPFLEVDGIGLHYTVKGSGIPIVFIHPPLLTSVNFEYQLNELSRYYQVITFDIRGHGRSGYSNSPITYSLIAEDIVKLLDFLEVEKALICGYSTGGTIVMEYLLTYANRALGGVSISGMSEVRDKYLKRKISVARSISNKGAISFLALAVSTGNANNLELCKKLTKEARKGDAINIEQYYKHSMYYNCTAQLVNIRLPVLLVYGANDTLFHPYAKILQRKLAFNNLKFIENVGHQIPTKAAKELNEMITQFVNTNNMKVSGE